MGAHTTAQMQACMKVVVEGVRRGLNRTESAALAHVNRMQIYRWLEGEGPAYDSFRNDLAHAESEFIEEQVQSILAAGLLVNEKTGQRDWRALAWVVERRFPNWSPKAALEMSGPGGGPIKTEGKEMTREEARAWLAEAIPLLNEIGKVEIIENGHAPLKERTS